MMTKLHANQLPIYIIQSNKSFYLSLFYLPFSFCKPWWHYTLSFLDFLPPLHWGFCLILFSFMLETVKLYKTLLRKGWWGLILGWESSSQYPWFDSPSPGLFYLHDDKDCWGFYLTVLVVCYAKGLVVDLWKQWNSSIFLNPSTIIIPSKVSILFMISQHLLSHILAICFFDLEDDGWNAPPTLKNLSHLSLYSLLLNFGQKFM